MIESKTIIKNLEVNYIIIGEGKPLLILHGWGSKNENWRKVGEVLSNKGFKVIIPDLPGFGKSQEPDVWGLEEYAEFVREFVLFFDLNSLYLLGHSFGGSVAVKYALKYPVKKLFMVAASCIRRKSVKKKVIYSVSKVLKPFSLQLFKKFFYRFIVKSDYNLTKGKMREIYLKVLGDDLFDSLKQIKAPVQIIWGEKDKITPLSQAKVMHKEIGGSEFVIIPGAGHDLNLKNPESLANSLRF